MKTQEASNNNKQKSKEEMLARSTSNAQEISDVFCDPIISVFNICSNVIVQLNAFYWIIFCVSVSKTYVGNTHCQLDWI